MVPRAIRHDPRSHCACVLRDGARLARGLDPRHRQSPRGRPQLAGDGFRRPGRLAGCDGTDPLDRASAARDIHPRSVDRHARHLRTHFLAADETVRNRRASGGRRVADGGVSQSRFRGIAAHQLGLRHGQYLVSQHLDRSWGDPAFSADSDPAGKRPTARTNFSARGCSAPAPWPFARQVDPEAGCDRTARRHGPLAKRRRHAVASGELARSDRRRRRRHCRCS